MEVDHSVKPANTSSANEKGEKRQRKDSSKTSLPKKKNPKNATPGDSKSGSTGKNKKKSRNERTVMKFSEVEEYGKRLSDLVASQDEGGVMSVLDEVKDYTILFADATRKLPCLGGKGLAKFLKKKLTEKLTAPSQGLQKKLHDLVDQIQKDVQEEVEETERQQEAEKRRQKRQQENEERDRVFRERQEELQKQVNDLRKSSSLANLDNAFGTSTSISCGSARKGMFKSSSNPDVSSLMPSPDSSFNHLVVSVKSARSTNAENDQTLTLIAPTHSRRLEMCKYLEIALGPVKEHDDPTGFDFGPEVSILIERAAYGFAGCSFPQTGQASEGNKMEWAYEDRVGLLEASLRGHFYEGRHRDTGMKSALINGQRTLESFCAMDMRDLAEIIVSVRK